jgi:uncharacterized protein YciI
MQHWLLEYDVVDDYTERRMPLRGEHLALAKEFVARGELVLGGALSPPTGALLVFIGETDAAARAFAAADPYVRQGVVKAWRVKGWTTVVGAGAATPL